MPHKPRKTGCRAADDFREVIAGLDAENLMELRRLLRAILTSREKSVPYLGIDWHKFSSLELAGVISVIDNHALTQFPPPPPAA